MSSDEEKSEKLAKVGRAAKLMLQALEGVDALEAGGHCTAEEALRMRQKEEARFSKVKLALFP